MGTVREPLAKGTKGAPHLGPERPRVYSNLSLEEKDQYNADIRATNILLQRLPKDIYTVINHYTDAKDIWDNVKMLLEGSELTKEDQESQLVALDEEKLLFFAGGQANAIDEDVDEQPVQDLALNVDNVFQADDCDAFDSDVHDHDHYQDVVCEHHEEHAMHVNVQLNHVVDSHADYTSDSNMIPYDHSQRAYHSLKINLTMYPPNTPATLVLRVLPMKSQVKIHIFTLIQLFLKFDKTCKKRITPAGLTEGERGFKQTKECYLKEVIPFFKTLKDNFKGIQKALTKEIKEMKYVFEELEVEVAQNVIDRKLDEIEQKNLLIANDNLIAECLSKEEFSVETNC
nr:retrovirus-related Pol polyprotein from transposon TNT 1-94 [Tanacetum cinerariifolium]